jgi:hypothetical protein
LIKIDISINRRSIIAFHLYILSWNKAQSQKVPFSVLFYYSITISSPTVAPTRTLVPVTTIAPAPTSVPIIKRKKGKALIALIEKRDQLAEDYPGIYLDRVVTKLLKLIRS